MDVRVGAPARCIDLNMTLSDNAVTLLGFRSRFYSYIKAMSEHTNKYGVYFVLAVNIQVLFPNTVQFIFFARGKTQCVKRYIIKYMNICL